MKKKIKKEKRELKWFRHFRIARFFSIRYYIPHFVRNVWHFRKELNEYRTWDFYYSLMMLHRSIELLCESIAKGHEAEHTRIPKVAIMEEVLYLIKRHMNQAHNEEARAMHNLRYDQRSSVKWPEAELIRKVYEKEVELENKDWDRIIEIFKDEENGSKTWWD